ncbi:general secretion pathway protein [Roseiconus nitratireducens]|uniref:General secretion pathway protein n=2 Tax=Roseiconus nitratireducens TaxID=2605748 RepID=A0A5M6DET8_9BACT|nr:general secretion pathway protein [Roseiconus nitratireducens]
MESAVPDAVDANPATVRFSFNGVPWREVINWIAEEASLALHVDAVPPGSFTYTDPSPFTFDEAIDRINLFLLPEGYSLVRSGNLLSVINLSDPRSLQQLDALAELVRPEELADRNAQDVVKCLFPLGALKAQEAVDELSAINLMVTPAVFEKTNQLMVTDTVAKLRNVKAVLESFEPSALDNGTVVKSFTLEHVSAEDVLVVARPHLGLATGEMIGIDVSLSSDLQGKHIFVTGIEDKVKLIERLVESIDVPEPSLADTQGDAKFQAHKIAGGNVELAYDVLQTLLAGQDVRLSKNQTAGTVVALAPPKVQEEIAATVAQLAADEAQFEVISLGSVDPFVAIGLIEEMLDLTAPLDDDDDDREARQAPKIDADPANRRLFVRGTPEQVEQIRQIVEGLDDKEQAVASDANIRLLSMRGKRALESLALAARFWRKPNPLVLFKSDSAALKPNTERVVHEGSDAGQPSEDDLLDAFNGNVPDHFVSLHGRGQLLETPSPDPSEPAIECQLTSRGLLVQCDDPRVLDQFEDHLAMLTGGIGSPAVSEPITFYLKYTEPAEALRMLAELLDGGDVISESTGGSLINSVVSSPTSSYLGPILTNRDGTLSLIAGTATIVADPRLNRLIAQGTTEDIDRIEEYLRIIEKDNSITSVETHGRSHVIELVHTRASEVEAALRKAFAGRVAEAASSTAGGGPRGGGDRDRERDRDRDDDRSRDNDRRDDRQPPARGGAAKGQDDEPKMTLAVHEPSNSLIVTAPDQLFEEVERLAKVIDGRGEQVVRVLTPSNSNVIEEVLQQVMLGQSASPSRSSRDRDRDRDRR